MNKETPSFKQRSSSQDGSGNDHMPCISYDHPNRYLYEFFNHAEYPKFKRAFQKALKKKKRSSSTPVMLQLNGSLDKKMLFLEIENVLLYFSLEQVPNLP